MGNPAGMRAKQKLKRRKKLEKRLYERDLAIVTAKAGIVAPTK